MDLPEKRYVLLLLAAAAFLGFLRLLREYLDLLRKHRFSVEFLENLNRYIESSGDDKEAYSLLVKRSDRLQKDLCSVPASGARSSRGESYSQCPVIINRLTEMRTSLSYGSLTRARMPDQYGVALMDTVTGHLGIIEDKKAEQVYLLVNPLVWLREGIGLIIALPLSILSWVGLISRRTLEAVREKTSFKVLKAIVTLAVIFSAVIVMFGGWPAYKGLIDSAAIQGKHALASLKRLL